MLCKGAEDGTPLLVPLYYGIRCPHTSSSSCVGLQGGILSGDAAEQTKDVLLLDVASLSLGIEVRASRVGPKGCATRARILCRTRVFCDLPNSFGLETI